MLTKENWKWNYSENVWERCVGARIRNFPISEIMVQKHAKAETKTWGKVNLGLRWMVRKLSEGDKRLCVMKSVVKFDVGEETVADWFARLS
jgi:hypothetical protein